MISFHSKAKAPLCLKTKNKHYFEQFICMYNHSSLVKYTASVIERSFQACHTVLFDLYCKCRYFLVVASLRNYVCICRLVVIDVYTSVQIQKDVNLSNPSEVYKFLQFKCGIEVADECHQSLVTFICNLNSTGTKLNVSQTLITATIDSR